MTLLLTHTDSDGTGCAMMLRSIDPDADVEFHDHTTMAERVVELTEQGYNDLVILADCIPNDPAIVTALVEKLGPDNVAVFDHHQDTEYIEQWEGNVHDTDACATLIMARELDVDQDYLKFAELIDVADRFQEDNPDFAKARQMSDLHNFIGQDAFMERGPSCDFDDTEQFVVDHLELQKHSRVQQAVDDKRVFKDSDGLSFAFTLVNESEVGQALCEDDDVDYCMMWSPERGGTVSLRSAKDGADVSQIAKHRGGGGHVNAAGYEPDVDVAALLVKAFQG